MTPKLKGILALLVIAAFAVVLWYTRKKCLGPDVLPPPAEIQIGWQRQWATQGQVMKTLDNTNIPALYGTNLVLRDFQYGPDLNEAAVTGAIQVTNAGIVPVINLLAKSDDWIVVARHIDFLVAIVARKNSGIKSVADLKGRRLGVPIAGGSHPYALSRLQDNGLSSGDGPDQVHIINVQPVDQPAMMRDGSIDAVAVWEPTISVLLRDGGTIIDRDAYCGFIVVKKSFALAHRSEVVQMLKAYVEAFLYTAQHKEQVDTWFSKASGIDYRLIANISAVEKTLAAKSIDEIDLDVDEPRLAKAQQVADVMRRLGLIDKPLQIRERIDHTFYKQASTELQNDGGKSWRVSPK